MVDGFGAVVRGRSGCFGGCKKVGWCVGVFC
jgi:hypothetical protein